ncbi:MAG TPA: dihydrolipoyl dehydrogenase [Candidatus Omnitrophota bacterium]|mgnify:FL=1|nr:dihydrolipoyl dehydrogenase [Candidatus Omnitrophota bacterium]
MENLKANVVVIGGGPGGYASASYAASCGKKVILIEKNERLGGACLNCGCIPSKALLHVAEAVYGARAAEKFGLGFSEPSLDLAKLTAWKSEMIEKLGRGMKDLGGRRGIEIIQGRATFLDQRTVKVADKRITFEHAIIATGSTPALPKSLKISGPLVMTSTEALQLQEIPKRLLVIGAGYIGMELGTVYAALGSKVTVVEVLPRILNGADSDLIRYVEEMAKRRLEKLMLNTKIAGLENCQNQVKAVIDAGGNITEELFDRVLVSTGRAPLTAELRLEEIGVRLDERGFVRTDSAKRTSVPSIYAVGDVTGGVMLAHKASCDARLAIDSIMGFPIPKSFPLIPAVVFTDPEVAWCGVTENEARSSGTPVQVIRFPWTASGRAVTMDRTDGVTKLLIDPATEKIIGAGICGKGAGELITETVLAIEGEMTAKELGRRVHPHPTLSETVAECAEMFYGRSTSAFSRKRNG